MLNCVSLWDIEYDAYILSYHREAEKEGSPPAGGSVLMPCILCVSEPFLQCDISEGNIGSPRRLRAS